MEALWLHDAAFVEARYRELQEQKTEDEAQPDDKPQLPRQRELKRILERARSLDALGPTSYLTKKFAVLEDILTRLYAPNNGDVAVHSPVRRRADENDLNAPVPLKELPLPTQVALKMFFRVCQSLRYPARAGNGKLKVQVASRLPKILTGMPPCVLSPGLADDAVSGEGVWSVFKQLFLLFEELLGLQGVEKSSIEQTGLSANDRATVVIAYIALSLKWGRMGYLVKGIQLLLEYSSEITGARLEPLKPLLKQLANTVVERPRNVIDEEEQPCGYLMSFGKGDHGKLGHGQCTHLSCQEGNCTENKAVPTMIAATKNILFRKIDSLSTHSIAVTTKGEAMAWGNGDKYRLGHGSSTKEYTPRTIEFLSAKGRVRDLACGLGHTLALMESGDLYAWGNGSNGRLGTGDTNDRSSPTKIPMPFSRAEGPDDKESLSDSIATSGTPVHLRHIFCGASHSLGVSWDGKAYSWGKNNQGQCGHGHTNDQWTIQEIESFNNTEDTIEEERVALAAGGWEHTLFCTTSGRVYSCGCGYKDSRRAGIPPVLGLGDCDRRLKPSLVQSFEDSREEIVRVACGWDHSLAISVSGRVYSWGSGTNGKLGHGDEESCDTPTLIRSMEGKRVKDAKAGCEHTVLLTYDHEIWTCGQGDSGRLGHGDNQTRKRLTKVELFSQCGLKPVALAVGDKYNLVLVTDSNELNQTSGEDEGNCVSPVSYRVGRCGSPQKKSKPLICTDSHQFKSEASALGTQYDANWTLRLAVGEESSTNSTGSSRNNLFCPDSAKGTALFIAGHMDRLASTYIHDEFVAETDVQSQSHFGVTVNVPDVALPYAADTAPESIASLLQLLRWTIPRAQDKTPAPGKIKIDNVDKQCLTVQERMGLTLCCLRILQMNLKKKESIADQHVMERGSIVDPTRSNLTNEIHEFLDGLAALTGEAVTARFNCGGVLSTKSQNLSVIGGAVSKEAAYALKMGFSSFYPTVLSQSSLLWEILGECEVEIPSMRTVILSDQLCKDTVMTGIFKSTYLSGSSFSWRVLSASDTKANEMNDTDAVTLKTLMLALLKRSTVEAISHLDNEASSGYEHEPNCFLKLLHTLQSHYFSLVHRFTFGRCPDLNSEVYDEDAGGHIRDGTTRMLDYLLEYLDCLLVEAVRVLKRLHKSSRQHEEIITWRLNGSFFHVLLPSSMECLSILLQQSQVAPLCRMEDKLRFVEHALPKLHEMLKMLDEISWKMLNAEDGGNQMNNDSAIGAMSDLTETSKQNWFTELGNVCAILCGKLSCELLYPSQKFQTVQCKIERLGGYSSLVLAEGRLLPDPTELEADPTFSKSARAVLKWERLGVFEVEDEIASCSSTLNSPKPVSLLPTAASNRLFLLQIVEADFFETSMSFWCWIAASLSYSSETIALKITETNSRLLTLALCVISWHLSLTDGFRTLYENFTKNPGNSDVSLGETIRPCFSMLIDANLSDYNDESVSAAAMASYFLVQLEPNPNLLPNLRATDGKTSKSIAQMDPPMELLAFMTQSTGAATSLRSALKMKEMESALSRIGLCIFHDLLRKLTTSSAKSALLGELVSVTAKTYDQLNPIGVALNQWNQVKPDSCHGIDKAVENLFVRLARIISSDDVSAELKRRALVTWTQPLSVNDSSVSTVVDLISKSGIVETLVDIILDDSSFLEIHSGMNVFAPFKNLENTHVKLPEKLAPVTAFLFSRSPGQTVSQLAWETFCVISMQLSQSDVFLQQNASVFLGAGGPNLRYRESFTSRNVSLSPRRRLTLPKKTVISTVEEVIEQMMDGLFLILKKVKHISSILADSTEMLSSLLLPSTDFEISLENAAQMTHASRVFLLGCPVPITQSTAHDIANIIPGTVSGALDSPVALTLSFWLYINSFSTGDARTTIATCTDNSRLVSIMSFGDNKIANQTNEVTRSTSCVVFISDTTIADRKSFGISVRCTESNNENWYSIVVNEDLPSEKWLHIAMVFDESEQIRIFVSGQRVNLATKSNLVSTCKQVSSVVLGNAANWALMTAGGSVDEEVRVGWGEYHRDETSENAALTPSKTLKKPTKNSFSAVLDDIIIFNGSLSQENVHHMETKGTLLFRLKQQNVADNFCTKVLRLLCYLMSKDELERDNAAVLKSQLSDRWIKLFVSLLRKGGHEKDIRQLYLCHLLQCVLPLIPSLVDSDINFLAQQLLHRPIDIGKLSYERVESIFHVFNLDYRNLTSTGTIWKQNECLRRAMQQHGYLRSRPCGAATAQVTQMEINELTSKAISSLKFSLGVELFQVLYLTPSWERCTDRLFTNSATSFQANGFFKSIIMDASSDTVLTDITAMINTVSGYSESVINGHRAFLKEEPVMQSAACEYSENFSSVVRLDNIASEKVKVIQSLVLCMLNNETRQHVNLHAREQILSQHPNDCTTVQSQDRKTNAIVHLRSRLLRLLMVTLLREQQSSMMPRIWHSFVVKNVSLTDDLLEVACFDTKDHIMAVLGPDSKRAMGLRRLRLFVKDILRGSKLGRVLSLEELESLHWQLWEEFPTSSARKLPWWEQHKLENEKIVLEVVGGDVEILDLKVKALEHFPTVRLVQADICANSGLWYYEVTLLTDGLMQIGYVDGDFTVDPLQGQGVGDHSNSWAFDGFRCKKWNVSSYDYGEHWRVNDVVGVLLDTKRMEISYYLNGKFLGVAFSGIPMSTSSRMCPAASLNVHQFAQFNFGSSIPSSLDPTEQTFGCTFQHLPELDNDEDQAHLRPIVFSFENRLFGSSGNRPNTTNNDATVRLDRLTDWNASSSDDNLSDSGEILLEPSSSPADLNKPLGSESQDGHSRCTAGQNGERNDHRRRDLVEELTELGFPLEWATRCASESRIPMDETGAVTWILKQMEKAGLEGSSLPPGSVPSADVYENSGLNYLQSRAQAQLPDFSLSQSADDLNVEPRILSAIATDNTPKHNDSPTECPDQNNNYFCQEKHTEMSPVVNTFIEAGKYDFQFDEVFPPSPHYRRQKEVNLMRNAGLDFSTSVRLELHAIDNANDVDDLVPLQVAVNSSLFVAYARQSFLYLILLALQEDAAAMVYKMVQRLLNNNDLSSRLFRLLRLALGLDTSDVMISVDSITCGHFNLPLQLQQAFMALLRFEVKLATTMGDSENQLPLFTALSVEMMNQCDRGLSLTLKCNQRVNKSASRSVSTELTALWMGWVSGLMLSFIESQIMDFNSADADTVSVTQLRNLAAVEVSPFYSTSYFDKLMLLASRQSIAWKYVAFKLISRICFAVRASETNHFPICNSHVGNSELHSQNFATTTPVLLTSTQFQNLLELFTFRRRREMYANVFYSELTCVLFTLLVRSFKPLPAYFDTNVNSNNQGIDVHVNSYSSNSASISWECTSINTNSTANVVDTAEISEDSTFSTINAEGISTIAVLEVTKITQNDPDERNKILKKLLPAKGSFAIQTLSPDTRYILRVGAINQNISGVSRNTSVSSVTQQSREDNVCDLILQTPPEPVFELDKDTMGNNLMILNQNLSAKNTVNKKWHSVRASVAFEEGVHQWQVRLDTCVSKNIFIGICTAEASMENYIGSDAYGYGFLANKAVWHNKSKMHSYGDIFKQGDIIQVTLDCNASTLAFSRNGEYLGIAASNLCAGVQRPGTSHADNQGKCKWYPAFSMYNKDDKLTLIPPPPTSSFTLSETRPQNISSLEFIEAMQEVLSYQEHISLGGQQTTPRLFEKAFSEYDSWRRGALVFREASFGEVIGISTSKTATDKYGIAANDTVFTSKGQCVVIGEYRHELWYEVDEGGNSLFSDATTPKISSWSLNTCREMLKSPDEYPVHRHSYRRGADDTRIGSADALDAGDNHDPNSFSQKKLKTISLQTFVEDQRHWCDSTNTIEMDAKLIASVDAIAKSQALRNPLLLSFSDISAAILIDKCSFLGKKSFAENESVSDELWARRVLARVGLLLFVNRRICKVLRLALPRNMFSSLQDVKHDFSSKRANAVSCVTSFMSSPYWTINDPSAFSDMTKLAASLLFSSQKERIINEELRMSKTIIGEDKGADEVIPSIKVTYPLLTPTPFWKGDSNRKHGMHFELSSQSKTTLFAQVAKQLSAQKSQDWRRENSKPFEAIPISLTFHVVVQKASTVSNEGVTAGTEPGKQKDLQQDEDDDDQQTQQPSSKQTARYLLLFENAVLEIQSPRLPLFVPANALPAELSEAIADSSRSLELDINVALFSPSSLANSRVPRSKLLHWYYCFGQLLGIAWRSNVILPLQYLSLSFWKRLASPALHIGEHNESYLQVREMVIAKIRDGLYSIIPSRCIALLSESNPSLRERLSDLDVNYVIRLEKNAVYLVSRQQHHDLFWSVIRAFTSVERCLLQQFINPERRSGLNLHEEQGEEEEPPAFILEIAEVLADGKDHPDSCYPVIVPVSTNSSRLHLPAYSSAQMLRQKLLLAMTNISFM